MSEISQDDFERVDLRVGRVVEAAPLEGARVPALVLRVDLGAELGVRKSCARITHLYQPAELVGRLVVAVVNLPPRQIGSHISECLVTGFPGPGGSVTLCVPDGDVPPGTRLA